MRKLQRFWHGLTRGWRRTSRTTAFRARATKLDDVLKRSTKSSSPGSGRTRVSDADFSRGMNSAVNWPPTPRAWHDGSFDHEESG